MSEYGSTSLPIIIIIIAPLPLLALVIVSVMQRSILISYPINLLLM